MATAIPQEPAPATTQIRVASPTGPVTRTVLDTPLRDALPSEIPIIDVSPIFSSSATARQSVARQINHAATNMGFFYIKNHGIPSAVIQDAYRAGLSFFHQDLQDKMAATIARSRHYNGYRALETQRLNPEEGVDVRESFSIAYDPRLDPQVQDVQDIPADALEHIHMEEHHFTETAKLPNFKDAMIAYFRACLALARALTRTVALSLDLPETAFDSKVAYPDITFMLNYYPPIPDGAACSPSDPDAKVSIGSHTDFQLFTMLWQDVVGGLQVLNRDGQWIKAKPVPDTLVVNIADCLQRITNDRYVSTIHRAQNSSGQARLSMACFWGFGPHETCQVLESCVAAGEEKKYADVKCFDWVRKRVDDMTELERGY
ncbi:hypothetical protein E4U42_006284 [Claviceps africana]|uniref:Fe2OG dioxygenase domain-containing protein n=1 Tax=Claviceps africana TaxID=83212 RepID=A0A8K0NGV9_9HYPO|nr:hypothetical protein E4U42_006284 [Claviceps africana]